MKRFLPVIFLASFAVFADDVKKQEAAGVPEHNQAGKPIEMAPEQDAGSHVNTILENLNRLVTSFNKAYDATGLSQYISKTSLMMVTLASVVSYFGYKKFKAVPENPTSTGASPTGGSMNAENSKDK
jgi:hypothetical protein